MRCFEQIERNTREIVRITLRRLKKYITKQQVSTVKKTHTRLGHKLVRFLHAVSSISTILQVRTEISQSGVIAANCSWRVLGLSQVAYIFPLPPKTKIDTFRNFTFLNPGSNGICCTDRSRESSGGERTRNTAMPANQLRTSPFTIYTHQNETSSDHSMTCFPVRFMKIA